jgi:hypothetical protein
MIELADGYLEVVMRRESAIPNISGKHVRLAGPWAWLGTVLMLLYLSTPAPASQVHVMQGQMVRLKLHDVLTTENVVKGDALRFDVAEDVVVSTHVVIHKGDPAAGRVVAVRGAGKRNAKDAAVIFQFVSVRSVDSQDIPLRARPDKPKKAESKENEIEANEPIPGYAQRVIGAPAGKEFAAYFDISPTINAPDTPVTAPPITPVVSAPTATSTPVPVQAAPPSPAPEEPATVDINSNPPGADILIDGVLVGNTPSIQHVDPGHHTIQLRIGGYSTWTRRMMVEPGSFPSIRATLEKQ